MNPFIFYFVALMLFAFNPNLSADAADIPTEESSNALSETVTSTDTPQAESSEPVKEKVAESSSKTFSPFTGKISKNRVRMRLNPSLDAPILRELNTNDLVLVVGENEDFYAIEPPHDVKGYIYRTYVLDGVIEGNHVNVRLEPDTTAPVIAQMNTGDKISSSATSPDKKWIEITPPSNTKFYISKEYVKNAGDASLITDLSNRILMEESFLAKLEKR